MLEKPKNKTSEQRQIKKEATRALTINSAIGVDLPKIFGAYISPHLIPSVGYGVTRINIFPSRFQSCFYVIGFCAYVSPFWNENVYLCHCMLEVFDFLLIFTEFMAKSLPLSPRTDLGLDIFSWKW